MSIVVVKPGRSARAGWPSCGRSSKTARRRRIDGQPTREVALPALVVARPARGWLVVHAKSAHIYEPEWALMAAIAERGPAATLR